MSQERLTDDELVAMTQQYDQTLQGEYVTHLAYAEINRQGAAGRQWGKCANCGNPYPWDKEGSGDTVCSPECFQAYVAYLNNPEFQ
jgi:hypothetical protein